MSWGTYLDEPLVEPVNSLQRLRVRKREVVRPQPDHVAVLLVQPDVRRLGPLVVDVPEAPPVCEGGQERARVAVEPVVEAVPGEPGHRGYGSQGEPVVAEEGEDGL